MQNNVEHNGVGVKSPLPAQLRLAAACLTDSNRTQDLSRAFEWLTNVQQYQPDEKVTGLMGYYFELCDDVEQAFSLYQQYGEENSYLADLRLAAFYEDVEHYQNAFYYYQLAMEKFGDSFSLQMMIYYLEQNLVDYDDFGVDFLKSLLQKAVLVERDNAVHNYVYYDLMHYLARQDDAFAKRYLCYYHLYVLNDKENSTFWLENLVEKGDVFSKDFFKSIRWPQVSLGGNGNGNSKGTNSKWLQQ